MEPVRVKSGFELLPNREYIQLRVYPYPDFNKREHCILCKSAICDRQVCLHCFLKDDPQFEFVDYGNYKCTTCVYIHCKKCTRNFCIKYRTNMDMMDDLINILRSSHNRQHLFEDHISTECEELTPDSNGNMRRFAF